MSSSFFALLSRMKYINRWALMRNAHAENLSEHSLDVAVIAHALVLLHNKRFGGSLNAERAAVLSLFHDAPEILTGDMPTPVKYYNEQVRDAYRVVEDSACRTILSMLPDDLKDEYTDFFFQSEKDSDLWKFVKAADKICALIKCIEEKKAGNTEFASAAESTLRSIKEMNLPEANNFIEEFLPDFEKTLDELKNNG
ncbi:MAG: 5'-deoxynucleotidase [Clostridia bacterium]|nr:5'-deoxynucleotidase [Clostridia bacterium]